VRCSRACTVSDTQAHGTRRCQTSCLELHVHIASSARRRVSVRAHVRPVARFDPRRVRLQAIAPRALHSAVDEGARGGAGHSSSRVAALVPRALAARDKSAVNAAGRPRRRRQRLLWAMSCGSRTPSEPPKASAFENRQKRFGPYIVHLVDSTNARVQLRVLATGRVVTDRRSGNGQASRSGSPRAA
jgi:hypothetical protein